MTKEEISKYVALILVSLSITFPSFTQDNKSSRADRKEQRQWEKEQRIILREQIREEASEITSVMVDS